MNPPSKRSLPESHENITVSKKISKQWRTPKKNQTTNPALTISPGDAGIWATCNMHKEAKATAELRDLFEDYAVTIYGEDVFEVAMNGGHNDKISTANNGEQAGEKPDIEAEIQAELDGIKASRTSQIGQNGSDERQQQQPLFQPVKLDIQCVLFFKTRAPIEPVAFVERICRDAKEGAARRSRCVKRLTPMSRMGKATVEGVNAVGHAVLDPIFHAPSTSNTEQSTTTTGMTETNATVQKACDQAPKRLKFAIRTSFRNHGTLKSLEVIQQIAKIVGDQHDVDLKGYNHLILVEVYKNMLGMSVVGSDFEKLKRYNLAEIYDPTPKPPKIDKTHATESGSLSLETSNSQTAAKGISKSVLDIEEDRIDGPTLAPTDKDVADPPQDPILQNCATTDGSIQGEEDSKKSSNDAAMKDI